MKLHVVFAQRKETYPGEYGLEALAVMSEADFDQNPSYIADAVAVNIATDEFVAVRALVLEVNEAEIRKQLLPPIAPIKATVVAG